MASDEEMKAKAVAEEKAAIFKELLKREPKASEEEIGKAKKELSEALNELGMVQEREKKDAAAVDLRIAKTYQLIKLVRKKDEQNDVNFPPDLACAMQLFGMANMLPQAKQMKECVDAFLSLLSEGPTGKPTSLGTGCLCWSCGYAGLPKNAEKCREDGSVPGVCVKCGEREQTNFFHVMKDEKTKVPWIEMKKEEEEEAGKVLNSAEKRKGGKKKRR